MQKIIINCKKLFIWALVFAFILPIMSKTSYASKTVDDRIEIEDFLEKVGNETVTTEEIEYFVNTLPEDLQNSIENELLEVISKIKFDESVKPYLKEDLTFYNKAGNNKVRETLENMSEVNAKKLRSSLEQRLAITLAALIELLLQLGFAWLVQEILNYGIRATCKNHSNANSAFRKYCKAMGYI